MNRKNNRYQLSMVFIGLLIIAMIISIVEGIRMIAELYK